MQKIIGYLALIGLIIAGVIIWILKRRNEKLSEVLYDVKFKFIRKKLTEAEKTLKESKASLEEQEKTYENLKKKYKPILDRLGLKL